MIEITNLKKSFDDNVILDNINLTIEKNDIFGLIRSEWRWKIDITKMYQWS